ncbi:MAG: methyltransferase domain-containing protein [Candidatus Kariarchaeaceae archaeon]|jgi:ubiquinone/menaquinone biosynthesis C-methylase UbiE
MRKESYFTEDLHSLKEYWEDKDRAVKFLSGGTRTGAIEYLLRRIEPDVHQGSWLDSGTGAGFIQSQIDSDVFPTLFVGLDFSLVMLRTQEQPYGEREVGSAFQVPFRNNSFDVVSNIFSLSDYPKIETAFEELGRVVEYSGTFVHLDYGVGDDYWERRQSFHGKANPDGSVIVGNINLRSLDQIKEWTPRGFRMVFQTYLEFEVDPSKLNSTFQLPSIITRRFILSEFYKKRSDQ